MARGPGRPLVQLPLQAVLDEPDPDPARLARVFEGRSNSERQALVARYLSARGIAFATHRVAGVAGPGQNYSVDVGRGPRALVLVAHHDAVPGSPGANDNAAAVGILLRLLTRFGVGPPPPGRVRFLFTAAEELGYLGARAYVREVPVRDIAGVVSLELCGVGDSPVLWDAGQDSALTTAFSVTMEGLGYRRDESYHVVGRVPGFGSDHRAFAAVGIPAYGLTMVPAAHAETLRRFIFHPWRSLVRGRALRPPPFDTYHTARDSSETLDAHAMDRVTEALDALIRGHSEGGAPPF
jgi:Zn-dependent M28 family amino/carboxypeptidase